MKKHFDVVSKASDSIANVWLITFHSKKYLVSPAHLALFLSNEGRWEHSKAFSDFSHYTWKLPVAYVDHPFQCCDIAWADVTECKLLEDMEPLPLAIQDDDEADYVYGDINKINMLDEERKKQALKEVSGGVAMVDGKCVGMWIKKPFISQVNSSPMPPKKMGFMQKTIQRWFGLDVMSAKLDHLVDTIAVKNDLAGFDNVNIEEPALLFITGKGIVNSILGHPSIDIDVVLNKKTMFYKS